MVISIELLKVWVLKNMLKSNDKLMAVWIRKFESSFTVLLEIVHL